MTRTLTLGVIGHVDHGKTALVRALTGIETDRLKEERERGLSIVLGFSYLETPHGVIDLIDVPGHENFVRAMVAGSTGLDGAVLVVAANEGVMPQTREHFHIARLLGLTCGIVVLNKTDLVSLEDLRSATSELRRFLQSSFLENAPIVATSALRSEGVDALRRCLAELAAASGDRPEDGAFYLPLDRVFTVRGFGVVGTGTLRGGRLRVDDRVEVMPSGRTATVRALQSRNRPIEVALPGQRVAVNLRNLDREDLARGDTLSAPGLLSATRRVDVELELLETDAPMMRAGLRSDTPVRLLIGTTEAIARIRLLDGDSLKVGSSALAQLYLDRELATHNGERFVIRTYSPMTTIGGGRVLDAAAPRHRRSDGSALRRLRTIAAGDSTAMLTEWVEASALGGVPLETAAERTALPASRLRAGVATMGMLVIEGRLVAKQAFAELVDSMLAHVSEYHRRHPRERGIAAGRLRTSVAPNSHEAVFRRALADLVESGRLRSHNGMLSLTDFDALSGLDERERAIAAQMEQTFRNSWLTPPPLDTLIARDKHRGAVYRLLLETGRLVRLRAYDRTAEVVLHAETLERVEQRLRERYPPPATFALKDVRELLASTRRYVLPLMEHFDATGVTVRLGELRRLREH